MRRYAILFRHIESFSISLAGHGLLLLLLLCGPTCRRAPEAEHRIYTFDLIDASRLTMRKPKEKAAAPQAKRRHRKKRKKRRIVKKRFELPKKESIEERIRKKLEEANREKWLEPSKLDDLEKAGLIDTGHFANAWYNDAVASKIYQCWRTPSKVLAEGHDLAVVVRFRIMRDGKVAITGIDKKSGSETLDRSALQAIKDAQPFPPLPDDYQGSSLEVCMTFIPEE